jgi:hypothetical protein
MKADASSSKEQSFRPRRTHTKSRFGCRNCKRRHVRCDETPGGCLKCKSHGIDCDYDVGGRLTSATAISVAVTDDASSSLIMSEVSTPSSFTTRLLASEYTSITPSTLPVQRSPECHSLSAETILHHFYTTTAVTCGSPASQAVHRSAVVNAAVQTPFLMYALLGLAAAHLRYLTPQALVVSRSRLKVLECYYWAEAFDGFRAELAGSDKSRSLVATKCSNVTRENMDQLLSTLMLVSMHQFSYRDYRHTEGDPAELSFVWRYDRTEREAALKWLGIEAGFKGLLGAMAPWLNESFWLPIMRRVDVEDEVDLDGWLTGSVLPIKSLDSTERRLAEVCGITSPSGGSNDYYTNVETLIWCRSFRPIGPEHFNQMIAFVGRTTPAFRELLLQRETPALLILVHWLQLMHGIGQWWIVERCRAEIRAIVAFLCKRHVSGRDRSEIIDLLREPAATVGFTITV